MLKTYMGAIELLHMDYKIAWGFNDLKFFKRKQKTALFIKKRLARYGKGI